MEKWEKRFVIIVAVVAISAFAIVCIVENNKGQATEIEAPATSEPVVTANSEETLIPEPVIEEQASTPPALTEKPSTGGNSYTPPTQSSQPSTGGNNYTPPKQSSGNLDSAGGDNYTPPTQPSTGGNNKSGLSIFDPSMVSHGGGVGDSDDLDITFGAY